MFVSPGTFATSTDTVVCAANGTWPRSLNVTDCVAARVDQLHLLGLRDRAALRRRPVDRQRDRDLHLLRVAAVVDRHLEDEARARRRPCSACPAVSTSEVPPAPFGSAATETMFVPCRPVGVARADRARRSG